MCNYIILGTCLLHYENNGRPRDIYLRAVQLGGQKEEVYLETDSYNIRKAFRKAGEVDV